MKAFRLNITESGSLGTPRDQRQPCSSFCQCPLLWKALLVQRRIIHVQKKRLDKVMEENPLSFINH